jgi:hypothetical protein
MLRENTNSPNFDLMVRSAEDLRSFHGLRALSPKKVVERPSQFFQLQISKSPLK